ncbi:MAG TPA: branched-chain amino acid ABC transporter permease, partial [Candidatus Elarobacter sp.]
GGMSLQPVQAPSWVPLDGQHWLYYVAWAVAGGAFAVSALLVRGKFGRALRALRDNPIAAVSFGVNPYFYKTLAFGWSAVLAGIAGSFLAIPTAFVSPDTFTSALSITLLIGAVLGGISSFWGALVGGLVIEFLPLLAQQVNAAAPSVVYGVALILVMMFLPDGIVGGVLRSIRRFRPAPPQPALEASTPPAAPAAVTPQSRE